MPNYAAKRALILMTEPASLAAPATDYRIAQALLNLGLTAANMDWEVESVSTGSGVQALDDYALDDYDLLVICDRSYGTVDADADNAIDASALTAIESYYEGGGRILMLCGGGIYAAPYGAPGPWDNSYWTLHTFTESGGFTDINFIGGTELIAAVGAHPITTGWDPATVQAEIRALSPTYLITGGIRSPYATGLTSVVSITDTTASPTLYSALLVGTSDGGGRIAYSTLDADSNSVVAASCPGWIELMRRTAEWLLAEPAADPGGGGEGDTSSGVPTTLEFLANSADLPRGRGRVPGTELHLLHGRRMVYAKEPSFLWGFARCIKGFDFIELRDADAPSAVPTDAWKRWWSTMEGRTIEIESADDDASDGRTVDKQYLVLQYIDEHHLRIGRGYNALTGEWGEHFNGATGIYSYRIRATKPGFWYSSIRSEFGAKPEYVDERSFVETPREVTALGAVGPYLIAFHAEGASICVQEATENDIAGTRAYTPAEELSTPEGCIAPRTVTRIPAARATSGAQMIALGSNGGILIGGPGGFGLMEPATTRLQNFLTRFGVIDSSRMKNAFAWVQPHPLTWCVVMQAEDAVDPEVEEPGGAFDTSAPTTDFFRGFQIDLNTGVVSTLVDFPVSCAMGITQSVAGQGEIPGKVFLGGTRGQVFEANVDEHNSLGAPSNAIEFSVSIGASSGGATAITLASATLKTTGDGLKGLVLIHIKSDGTEYRYVVASNTVNTVTPTSNWTVAVVAGDLVRIAPLRTTLRFPEWRWRYPANARHLRVDATFPEDRTTSAQINFYREASGTLNPFASTSGVLLKTKYFENDDIARGDIALAGGSSKALAALWSNVFTGEGTWELHGLEVGFVVAEEEE